tara:strand:- start:98 stop:382 length:285 start_codon:yes stop_codon:yes gene_type:complete
MGQYDDKVERQRILLEAEEWANGVKEIHAHSMNSMHYDNRPQDTEDGKSVLDVSYNSGLIKRKLEDGSIVYFGREMTTDELIDAYGRAKAYERG